jgi:hypothetical protein
MKLRAIRPLRPFEVGDRVRLSPFGRKSRPRMTRNTGTVVGYSENSIVVRVLFDGRKTPSKVHASFLEVDPMAHIMANASAGR